MAHALCLQPWINVQGTSNSITQPPNDWADLVGYYRGVVYLEVSDVTITAGVTTSLALVTGVTQDTAFTLSAVTYNFATSPTVVFGVQPLRSILLDRYLAWSLTFGSSQTQITFRVWLNLLRAGW